MNHRLLIGTAAALGLLLVAARSRSFMASPVRPFQVRQDDWGQGQYGTPRGSHSHAGLDLVVQPGQVVRSPIQGMMTRIARPYPSDQELSGMEIEGRGKHAGFVVKLFYVLPSVAAATTIRPGQAIGQAQAVSARYGPSMQDHIHMEVRYQGILTDPYPLLT